MMRKQAPSGVIQPAAKKPRNNKAIKVAKATKNSGPFTPLLIPITDDPNGDHTGDYSVYSCSGNIAAKSGGVSDNDSDSDDDGDDDM